ncbi:MAG TPA: single-stranded DNA-binding protein [Parapedobacter sp.]|uniref:single-stranded DNA-binding protein n=1 Tax=Parapedobacter sp. TaxID=1958893 RepID=UPI002CD0FCCB|nr:single-stranded DNA-binding protein [Parapedobacter sp.]HWK55789.1 single-stranded DNA-binding protein [Parapedobacter sp.]
MASLKNSVRLTGFLGKNPEMKTLNESTNLARVSLATNERYRNEQGEWTTHTQWHHLVFWGRQAAFAEKALTKGSEIAIEGKLVNRQYVDKDGVTRYVTEVNVKEVLQLNRKPE